MHCSRQMRVTYEFDEKFDFVGNGMDLDEEISVWIKAANSLLEFSPGSRDPKLEQQAINGFTRIMLSIDCMLEITEIDDENLTIYSALLRRQMNILSCCFSLRPNYKVIDRAIYISEMMYCFSDQIQLVQSGITGYLRLQRQHFGSSYPSVLQVADFSQVFSSVIFSISLVSFTVPE